MNKLFLLTLIFLPQFSFAEVQEAYGPGKVCRLVVKYDTEHVRSSSRTSTLELCRKDCDKWLGHLKNLGAEFRSPHDSVLTCSWDRKLIEYENILQKNSPQIEENMKKIYASQRSNDVELGIHPPKILSVENDVGHLAFAPKFAQMMVELSFKRYPSNIKQSGNQDFPTFYSPQKALGVSEEQAKIDYLCKYHHPKYPSARRLQRFQINEQREFKEKILLTMEGLDKGFQIDVKETIKILFNLNRNKLCTKK